MSAKLILTKARALIENGFARGSWAMDSEGNAVDPRTPMACCFCSMGAIMRVEQNGMVRAKALSCLSEAMVPNNQGLSIEIIPEFNDTRSREEVLAAFDKAIELCPN